MVSAKIRVILTLSTSLVLSGCIADRLQEQGFDQYASTAAQQAVQTQQPQLGSLSMKQAITLAIRHSSDIRVRELEAMIHELAMGGARIDMLPSITAKGGYYAKMSSSTFSDGASAGLSASANTLDFGLNYFRSKQSLYRYGKAHLAADELAYRIAAEARNLYWQTTTVRRFNAGVQNLGAETSLALRRIEAGLHDRNVEKRLMLGEKQELLQAMADAQKLQASLNSAEIQLASLIGQGVPRHLTNANAAVFRKFAWRGRQLELDVREALQNRPELRTAFYDAGISNLESQMDVLRSLPIISAALGASADPSSLPPSFASLAVDATFNLIKLADLPRKLKSRDFTQEMGLASAKAAGEAVALRVMLLRTKIKNVDRDWLVARELDRTQGQVLLDTRRRLETGLSSKNRVLIERYRKLMSEVKVSLAASDAASVQFDYSDALGRPLPIEQEVSMK